MTKYAPGTPLSVINKMDKKLYGTPLPKGKPQVQPTKPTGTKADPLKKVKTPQPVTKAVQDFRKQLGGAGKPMPRPQIDEGFGNGPGRPFPPGKPIIQNPKPMGTQAGALSPRGAVTGGGRPATRPVKDLGTGNGAGRPVKPMMKAGGKVADGAAKKGKTKGRYI